MIVLSKFENDNFFYDITIVNSDHITINIVFNLFSLSHIFQNECNRCCKCIKYFKQFIHINKINDAEKKHFNLAGENLRKYFEILNEKYYQIAEKIINMDIKYDEEDATTWVENFISLPYKDDNIYFSHFTNDGLMFFELHHFLITLEDEIKNNSSICFLFLPNT